MSGKTRKDRIRDECIHVNLQVTLIGDKLKGKSTKMVQSYEMKTSEYTGEE